MRVAVTGSSGLIGTELVTRLRAEGHDVVTMMRHGTAGDDRVLWSPSEAKIDVAGLEGVDAVIHLAGAGIADKRWSTGRKRELVESRVGPTELLARTLAGMDNPPDVLVSASAIGWYGDRGDEELTEASEGGEGFLAQLCQDWEAAARPAREAGIRVVNARTGLVLAGHGGALAKQLPLFKAGVGGRLGSGKQWWSWISMTDEVEALIWLLSADLHGPVNLTGPEPVTNAAFAKGLGQVVHRPTVLPIPRFGPRLLMGGELAQELLFAGQRVLPTCLVDSGYRFAHESLEEALRAELSAQ